MKRTPIIFLLLCLLGTSPLAADELILLDGRTFTGSVSVEGDTVVVSVEYGSMRFAKSEVARIVFNDTPEVAFARRLEAIRQDSPRELYALAVWAREKGLAEKSAELCSKVLELDPNHEQAHRQLGHVRVDTGWVDFAKGLELARSRLAAGSAETLLKGLLPELIEAAEGPDVRTVRDLLGRAYLRLGRYEDARKTFAALAKDTRSTDAFLYAVLAELLGEHEDGMYVLQETYPPTAKLLGSEAPASLPPGPAPLSHPLAVKAALRDRARELIQEGRKVLDAATELEASDPDLARSRYAAAGRVFDKADVLTDGIARSYRIEMARRQIASLRRDVKVEAEKFDDEANQLGERKLSASDYRTKVRRLIYLADKVRTDLKEIMKIAKPYSRELILEVKFAERDLAIMDKMRQNLTEELDER